MHFQAVQSAIRESVFSALSGEQWVGYRVRASTHRILQPGERRVDARDAGGSAYSTGTVKCYRPSSGEHLVVFDDHMLQPQWVVCQKSQIDVLLGEEGAKPSSEGAVAAEPGIAAACTFHLTVCKGQAVDYSVQCNCVLCDNALVQGTFRRCTKCGLKCHSYCLIEDTAAPGAESAVPQYWPVSTALPWTCWNCVGEFMEHLRSKDCCFQFCDGRLMCFRVLWMSNKLLGQGVACLECAASGARGSRS